METDKEVSQATPTVQSELALVHTAKLEPGVLPGVICVMYKSQRQLTWHMNREQLQGFGALEDTWVDVLRQGERTVGPELVLATFDEVALKKHVEEWGTKVHEKDSIWTNHYGHGPKKDRFETWLHYEKVEFQQLQGVRLLSDAQSIEIELETKERKKEKGKEGSANG